jgi:hypothetical protein
MDEAGKERSRKRPRGRPYTLPFVERLRWVVHADTANALAFKSARMQSFDRKDESDLAQLPYGLRLIVRSSWAFTVAASTRAQCPDVAST